MTDAELVREIAEPLSGLNDYDRLLELIGDARFVLLGEATHGTHNFIPSALRSRSGSSPTRVSLSWHLRRTGQIPPEFTVTSAVPRPMPAQMKRFQGFAGFLRGCGATRSWPSLSSGCVVLIKISIRSERRLDFMEWICIACIPRSTRFSITWRKSTRTRRNARVAVTLASII